MRGTNSVLINYAGYPSSSRMLVPDNGLANLAGALLESGHTTTIIDFATTDTIERLFPYEYSEALQGTIRRIMKSTRARQAPEPGDIAEFHRLDEEISALQRKKVAAMAAELGDFIENNKIDFVGFKLWMGDGFEGSLIMAREIKKRFPALPVFAGGPHVDWFGEKILRYSDHFDALVYGEGEEVIVMLAEYVQGKRPLDTIPNLIYRRRGITVIAPRKAIEDLNSLPRAVYDTRVYPAMAGNRKLKLILIDDSRGCPNTCNFCLHPVKSGKRWKTKSPGHIVDDMEHIRDTYGISAFRLAGSNTPKFLLQEMGKEILKRKLNVSYVAFANSGAKMTNEEFRLLKESGCFGFWFGIESGNQKILDEVMNKNIRIDDLKNKMSACKEAGLFVTGSIIIPAPGENEQTKAETLEFLMATGPDSVIIDPPVIVPGTTWAENHKKYGIVITDKDAFEREVMLYKINMLYPPSLLKEFPYFTINGKADKQIIAEAGAFNQMLEARGMLTQVTIDTALIAQYARLSPREFRDRSREYFMTGDRPAIERQVKGINDAILGCGVC